MTVTKQEKVAKLKGSVTRDLVTIQIGTVAGQTQTSSSIDVALFRVGKTNARMCLLWHTNCFNIME